MSEHLVESNLQSVDSHGAIRLTQYTDQVYWDWVELGKRFEFPYIQVRKGLLVPDGRPTERRCVLIRLKSMIQMISCSSSRSRLYFNSTFGT